MIENIIYEKSEWNNFYDMVRVQYSSGLVRTYMRGAKGFPETIRNYMKKANSEHICTSEEAYTKYSM